MLILFFFFVRVDVLASRIMAISVPPDADNSN